MSHTNQKPLKCVSCPTILDVDRHTEWCQCGVCIQGKQPRPRQHHYHEHTDAGQLELQENAS